MSCSPYSRPAIQPQRHLSKSFPTEGCTDVSNVRQPRKLSVVEVCQNAMKTIRHCFIRSHSQSKRVGYHGISYLSTLLRANQNLNVRPGRDQHYDRRWESLLGLWAPNQLNRTLNLRCWVWDTSPQHLSCMNRCFCVWSSSARDVNWITPLTDTRNDSGIGMADTKGAVDGQ